MPPTIAWKASLSATSLHTAYCRHTSVPAADGELAAALNTPAEQLVNAIAAAGWSVDGMLPALLDLASEFDNNRALVERAVTRQLGPTATASIGVAAVGGVIADLENALLRYQPEVVEQLAARGRPIREQWEARGPGLLRQATRLTDESLQPAAAQVVLVAPFAGGHGVAHPKTNRVTLEAVLANPHAQLPEVVRLAWLLAQLNLDLPRFAEAVDGPRMATVGPLALIPTTLAASESVELARLDRATLELALSAWRLPGDRQATTDALLDWWGVLEGSSTEFPVALAALDRMLA